MTEPSGWLGTAITIGVYLVGGGVFVGVVRNSIAHLTTAVQELKIRVDRADGSIGDSEKQGAAHDARLQTAEKAADAALSGYHSVMERLAAFEAESKADHRYTKEALERLDRGQQNHSRQLANIASGRSGAAYEVRALEDGK